MTRFIAIGSPEHVQRLAWQNEDGLSDGQRYTASAYAAIQEHRIEAEQTHNVALEAGGYWNPYEHLDDVADTDPLVVGYDHIARDLLAAENLLDVHLATGIDLTNFQGVRELVDWALDYAGVAFDADVAPKACNW